MGTQTTHIPIEEIIDLYAGAGGTSLGFENAMVDGFKICKVIACVNHDPTAIKSHAANFPDCLHLTEDVRLVNVHALPRKSHPDNVLTLHASLECTEHSKAKNGAKDAEGRTLPLDLLRYVDVLQPDYITIENVAEFMSWGDLGTNGKPLKRKNGRYYLKWVQAICDRGYRYDYRLLNAADYGQHTKRIRYFAIFAKGDLPIAWPTPTHAEHPDKVPSLHGVKLKKWRPVIECLDLHDVGRSVFNRKNKKGEDDPIVDKTCIRLRKGVGKFVQEAKLIMHCNSPGYCSSANEPLTTLTKKAHKFVVNTQLLKYYGTGTMHGTDLPSDTLTKKDRMALIMEYYGMSGMKSANEPLGTITKKDKFAAFRPIFIHGAFGEPETNPRNTGMDKPSPTICKQQRRQVVFAQPFIFRQFSGGGWYSSAQKPVGAMQKVPKMNMVVPWIDNRRFEQPGQSVHKPSPTLTRDGSKYVIQGWLVDSQFDNSGCSLQMPMPTLVRSRRHFNYATAFIVNPQYSSDGASVHKPCPTIIRSQKSLPLSLALATYEGLPVQDQPGESEEMRKLKAVCREKGICDITMRMLNVGELKEIQGFGRKYVLMGNATQQKAFIGQSVCPLPAQRWSEARNIALTEWLADGHRMPTKPLYKVEDHWFEEVFCNSATVNGLAVTDEMLERRAVVQQGIFDEKEMTKMVTLTPKPKPNVRAAGRLG